MNCEMEHKIFEVDASTFEATALEVYQFQYKENPVYRAFSDLVHRNPSTVKQLSDIPFMPIGFFKSQTIQCGSFNPQAVFESSGTTQTGNSKHEVKELAIYQESFRAAFTQFYGKVDSYCVLGLLPSYLERKGSSLVYMVDDMIRESQHPQSGTYLYDHAKLAEVLQSLEAAQQPTLLIGVTFALLDFAAQYPMPLQHTIVMETGGMKGRREEWTREQVHQELQQAFSISNVHSEYGMTELLSQAYSQGNGLFSCPPWMRVLLREEEDPFNILQTVGARGVVNVIDLANLYSCSFIATEDAGKLHANNQFEVLGRVDYSDIRGCSLMSPGIQ